MYSLQEVHFHGMLGYAVLKLVKQLAAVAQSQVALVQLKLSRSEIKTRGLDLVRFDKLLMARPEL